MTIEPETERPAGLLASLGRLIQSVIGLIQTRLELLSTDIEAARFNLVRTAVVTVGVLICFQMAIFLGAIFVVLVVPEESRTTAVGIAALVLLFLALAGALWLRHWFKHRPPFFAATIGELRKDRERLQGKS
jgi:uncharacterized membrane protein YqjE